MVKLWLRVRSYVALEDLLEQTKLLSETARVVEAAMWSSLQATRPKEPAYCGAILVADIMLAGFSHAARTFNQIVAATVTPELSQTDIPEFWWGPEVEEFKTMGDVSDAHRDSPEAANSIKGEHDNGVSSELAQFAIFTCWE